MDSLNKGNTINRKSKKIKSVFIYVLIYCLFVEIPLSNMGCYSYYTLNDSEYNPQNIKSQDNLKFILKNKSEIETSSKDCYFIKRDTTLFYGIGLLFMGKDDMNPTYFNGFINKADIDSMTFMSIDPNLWELYWLKNNTIIRCDNDKIIDLSKSKGVQRWLVKENKDKLNVFFSHDIGAIQIQKFNIINTVLIAVPLIIVLGLLVFGSLGIPSKINLGGQL